MRSMIAASILAIFAVQPAIGAERGTNTPIPEVLINQPVSGNMIVGNNTGGGSSSINLEHGGNNFVITLKGDGNTSQYVNVTIDESTVESGKIQKTYSYSGIAAVDGFPVTSAVSHDDYLPGEKYPVHTGLMNTVIAYRYGSTVHLIVNRDFTKLLGTKRIGKTIVPNIVENDLTFSRDIEAGKALDISVQIDPKTVVTYYFELHK